MWSHLERQDAGGSYAGNTFSKGMGEKQAEVDRRLVKEQMNKLERQVGILRAGFAGL